MFARGAIALFLALAAWVGLVPGAAAQAAGQTYVLPLGVYDKDGKFVEGLKPEQIRVKGVKATVKRLELDTGPRRIILLLDMSGSMGEHKTAWEFARNVTKALLSAIGPGNSISFHVFADKHVVLVPLTDNLRSVHGQLDALPRPGSKEAKQAYGYKTVLVDALARAMDEFEGESKFGNVVLLVSDGGSVQPSNTKLSELRSRLCRSGVRVFPLLGGLVLTLPLAGEDPWGMPVLEDLARNTGGEMLIPWQGRVIPAPGRSPEYAYSEDVGATVEKAARQIRSVYRLELEVWEPQTKPRKLSLDVFDERGHRISREQVFHPRYLVPQSTNP